MSLIFEQSSPWTQQRSQLTENVADHFQVPAVGQSDGRTGEVLRADEIQRRELELEIAEKFRHGNQLNFGKVFSPKFEKKKKKHCNDILLQQHQNKEYGSSCWKFIFASSVLTKRSRRGHRDEVIMSGARWFVDEKKVSTQGQDCLLIPKLAIQRRPMEQKRPPPAEQKVCGCCSANDDEEPIRLSRSRKQSTCQLPLLHNVQLRITIIETPCHLLLL